MAIPVIKFGKSKVVEDVTGKAAKIIKAKVKQAKKAKKKSEPKPRAKRAKRSKRTQPKVDLTQVPAQMAPPEMKDTRPVHVPEPAPEAKPSVPEPAIGDQPAVPVAFTETEAKPRPIPLDTRLVQGATCTWIGPLEAAPDSPETNHPVCPHCFGNLLTSPDRATIELGLEQFELGAYDSINPPPRRHPGYKDLIHWVMEQDTCWPTIEAAALAYKEATGKVVDPSR